jgi:hypothetical protein
MRACQRPSPSSYFLAVQARVIQASNQEVDLLNEGFLDRQRRSSQLLNGPLREVDIHRAFLDFAGLAPGRRFFRKAAISAPFLNGPWYGPFSASARLALTMRCCSGVYSSGARNLERPIANWGVMTILFPTARTSTNSPSARPTAERTVRGMVIWPLCWTLTRVLIGLL